MRPRRVVVVLAADRSDDVAGHLAQLGADVVAGDLFDDPTTLLGEDEARVLVIDVGARPDLAGPALRNARKDPGMTSVPVIVGVAEGQVGNLEPSQGHDDFVALPCPPQELYARIRQLEWKRSEFSLEERTKVGPIIVDRSAHEVTKDGRPVTLTAREFSLLSFLAANRGRVFSRESLLSRVWGARYEGGVRTVDIHVRRLRAKLGEALPLETIRGAGYRLKAPQ
jgi:DNA-binding response OmpR family regulator